jgi:hypothetical protein
VRRFGGVDEVAQHAHEAQRVVEVREVARRWGRSPGGCSRRAGGRRARAQPGRSDRARPRR